jgi:N6-L-threonylcarbamoyladenine synthase
MRGVKAKQQTILSIETSCDETGIALVECSGDIATPRMRVKKNTLTSQIKVHAPFGGVVPNLAKREHLRNLPILYEQLFGAPGSAQEKKQWAKIDVVAVTVGPGLEPALWTGIEFAKQIAKKWRKPLVGANHMQGHLYSMLLDAPASTRAKLRFPAVALVVSGGHTMLLLLEDLTRWKKLGETRDDAVGEAFDKVARLLHLPYPGGPEISRLAVQGNEAAIPFPRPMVHEKNFDFSYSGLKTAVLYYMRDHARARKADVAASFEEAAIDVLAIKTFRAVEQFGAKSVILGGGVAANKRLRERLASESRKRRVRFFMPKMQYNTDNAAMIGAAAYIQQLRRKRNPLVANGRLNIGT